MSRLVEGRELKNLRKEVQGMGALYEAEGNNIGLRLINDRGCVTYDIYSLRKKSCYWDGEILSEILNPREEKERKRSVRRLSLEQQTELFLKKWDEIETLMDKENVSETDKTLSRLGTERSRILFKPKGANKA